MWLVYVIMFLTLKKKKTLKCSYIYLSEHPLWFKNNKKKKDVNALTQLGKEL